MNFPDFGKFAALLQHRLQVVSDLEGSFGLFLNLVDGDAVGNLHKREALGKVYIKDALQESVSTRQKKSKKSRISNIPAL